MSSLSRRSFLKRSLAAAATITIAGTKSSGRVLGANDTIRIAVAGLNGRGGAHVGAFAGMKGVRDRLPRSTPTRAPTRSTSSSIADKTGGQAADACRTSARRSKTRTSTPSRSPRRTTGTR